MATVRTISKFRNQGLPFFVYLQDPQKESKSCVCGKITNKNVSFYKSDRLLPLVINLAFCIQSCRIALYASNCFFTWLIRREISISWECFTLSTSFHTHVYFYLQSTLHEDHVLVSSVITVRCVVKRTKTHKTLLTYRENMIGVSETI